MAISHPPGSMYIDVYLDDNDIGPQGCEYLMHSQWGNLTHL